METVITCPSIHREILTSREILILVGTLTLTGTLVLAGILTRMLKVAGILAGILILAKILTPVRTFPRILTRDGTPALEETDALDGREHQLRTGHKQSDAGPLTKIPMPARSLTAQRSGISGGPGQQPQTEHWGAISGMEMEDIYEPGETYRT